MHDQRLSNEATVNDQRGSGGKRWHTLVKVNRREDIVMKQICRHHHSIGNNRQNRVIKLTRRLFEAIQIKSQSRKVKSKLAKRRQRNAGVERLANWWVPKSKLCCELLRSAEMWRDLIWLVSHLVTQWLF